MRYFRKVVIKKKEMSSHAILPAQYPGVAELLRQYNLQASVIRSQMGVDIDVEERRQIRSDALKALQDPNNDGEVRFCSEYVDKDDWNDIIGRENLVLIKISQNGDLKAFSMFDDKNVGEFNRKTVTFPNRPPTRQKYAELLLICSQPKVPNEARAPFGRIAMLLAMELIAKTGKGIVLEQGMSNFQANNAASAMYQAYGFLSVPMRHRKDRTPVLPTEYIVLARGKISATELAGYIEAARPRAVGPSSPDSADVDWMDSVEPEPGPRADTVSSWKSVGVSIDDPSLTKYVDPMEVARQNNVLQRSGRTMNLPAAKENHLVLLIPPERHRDFWNRFNVWMSRGGGMDPAIVPEPVRESPLLSNEDGNFPMSNNKEDLQDQRKFVVEVNRLIPSAPSRLAYAEFRRTWDSFDLRKRRLVFFSSSVMQQKLLTVLGHRAGLDVDHPMIEGWVWKNPDILDNYRDDIKAAWTARDDGNEDNQNQPTEEQDRSRWAAEAAIFSDYLSGELQPPEDPQVRRLHRQKEALTRKEKKRRAEIEAAHAPSGEYWCHDNPEKDIWRIGADGVPFMLESDDDPRRDEFPEPYRVTGTPRQCYDSGVASAKGKPHKRLE